MVDKRDDYVDKKYDKEGFDGNEDGAFDEEGEDILEALESEEAATSCPHCNSFALAFGLVWLYDKLVRVISCLQCGYVSDPNYDEWVMAG